MTSAQQIKQYVWDTLRDYFDATDRDLTADDVATMTELNRPAVATALRLLSEEGRVRGVQSWQASYPARITGINRDA